MSGILIVARACMTLLGPMTGTGATGNLTVSSTGATGTVPKNSYGIPVIGNALSKTVLLKTTAATNVTSAGVAVPVKAIFGNTAGNLAAATSVVWDPPLTGIEARSVVASPGMTGGVAATGRQSVAEIQFYEDIRGALNADLLRTGLGRFPAIVLAWDESRDRDEMGRLKNLMQEAFTLFVVTSRKDSHGARAGEGLDILEEATERLFRREACDGEVFTSPAPLLFQRRGRLAYGPEHYVYFARFTVDRSVTRREPSDAAGWTGWYDWEQTQVDIDTDSDTTPEKAIVDQVLFENTT